MHHSFCIIVCCRAVRSAILATAGLLVTAWCDLGSHFLRSHFHSYCCTLSFTGLTFQIESNASSVYSCTDANNQAPRYLMDHCSPVSDVVCLQRLRSASSHQLSIPCYRLSTYGRRAFSVAGPTVWNYLRDPECCADTYRQSLKTFLFSAH